MLGEVVAHEHVEQVGIAAQVRVGQCDQLSVTGRGRVLGGSVPGGRGRRPGARRPPAAVSSVESAAAFEDLGGRVGMVADQAVKEGGVVVGHTCTVDLGADGSADGR